ncbi:MAG: GntR family transcriptional regulator [Deltaproteobacteria bacterium]|nr:GntR family transcriptional regulator [Deltaproteobacteria bacterium]
MPGANKETKFGERSDLAHKAYMGIRQMLFYNEIIPGQKIKYQDLADRLDVSITPVIHALKWLEFKGIVRHEPNKGYCVNEVSLQEIREIYETRLVLEVAILPQTIDNLDESGIHLLQASLDSFEEMVKESNHYGRLMTDMKFHFTLASLSQCRIQLKMLEELFDLLFLKYSRNLVLTSIMETSLHEHQKIFESLKTRNLREVQNILSGHLKNVKDHILEKFDRMVMNKKEPIFDFQSFL